VVSRYLETGGVLLEERGDEASGPPHTGGCQPVGRSGGLGSGGGGEGGGGASGKVPRSFKLLPFSIRGALIESAGANR